MYIPEHFAAPSAEAIVKLIHDFPLAHLLTGLDAAGDQPMGLTINPVPMVLAPSESPGSAVKIEPGARLWAHVARANPMWQTLADKPQAMALFNGPSAYITPNAYPSKQTTHRVVPTYNYTTVQLTGQLMVHHDPEMKQQIVTHLTQHHEANQAVPWSVNDAPIDYLQAMLKAIVGLEFTVHSVQAKWKVSQNRSSADQAGVISELQGRINDPHAIQMATLIGKQ